MLGRWRVRLRKVQDLMLWHLEGTRIWWTLHHWVVVGKHRLVGRMHVMVEERVGAMGGLGHRGGRWDELGFVLRVRLVAGERAR